MFFVSEHNGVGLDMVISNVYVAWGHFTNITFRLKVLKSCCSGSNNRGLHHCVRIRENLTC